MSDYLAKRLGVSPAAHDLLTTWQQMTLHANAYRDAINASAAKYGDVSLEYDPATCTPLDEFFRIREACVSIALIAKYVTQ